MLLHKKSNIIIFFFYKKKMLIDVLPGANSSKVASWAHLF